MLYKKNGLLNTLRKLFGRYRGAKRHERQNPIFYVFSLIFYAFANFSYLVSANLIEYDLIIYLLGIPSDKILFWGLKRSTDWKSASLWRLHVGPLPVYRYQLFYPLFASFVDQRTLFTLHNDFNSYSTLKMLSVLRLQIAYILQLKRYMTQYFRSLYFRQIWHKKFLSALFWKPRF